MILALAFAAALSGQAAPAPAASAAPVPPAAPVPVAAPDPPQSAQDRMDALQQVYDSSCGSRGYGAYDDVCNSIREQIRQADKVLSREARHPGRTAPSTATSKALAPKPLPAAAETPPTTAPPGGYSAAPAPPRS